MDAAVAPPNHRRSIARANNNRGSQLVSAAEFRQLLVSHRRLIRVDRRDEKMRGLKDVDTGELFFTDEHRLLESPRR